MIKIEVVTYEFDEGTCFEEIVSLADDALVCSVDIMDENKVKTSTNGGGYCRLTEPVDITFYNYEIITDVPGYDDIVLEHLKEVGEEELRNWFEGLEDGYYELATHFVHDDENQKLFTDEKIVFDECVLMKSDARCNKEDIVRGIVNRLEGNPELPSKSIWGYLKDREPKFEYLDIPHDGADEAIRDINVLSKETIERIAQQVGLPTKYLWRGKL